MLKGKHLHLRTVERRDLEMLRHWRNSDEVGRFYQDRQQISQLQQEKWFDSLAFGSGGHYFVIETDPGPVGVCNVKNIDPVHRVADYGIYFVPQSRPNPLLPVEAAILVLDHAFDHLNIRKIYGNILACNARSLSFNESLGFRQEGVLRQQIFHEGQYVDLVLVGVFADEFRQATQKYRQLISR